MDNIRLSQQHFLNVWWFRDQVKSGGPWDYKNEYGAAFEHFGNFNYGATGSALGLPTWFLLREAGRAQEAAGTSRPEWGDPGPRYAPWLGTGFFGDDPIDQYWIDQGISFYSEYDRP